MLAVFHFEQLPYELFLKLAGHEIKMEALAFCLLKIFIAAHYESDLISIGVLQKNARKLLYLN